MILIRFKPLDWLPDGLSCAGLTFLWFVFYSPSVIMPNHLHRLKTHEAVHVVQQTRWFLYGLIPGVIGAGFLLGFYGWTFWILPCLFCGIIAWLALYFCFWPTGSNHFRRKWETEAFEAQGLDQKTIAEILRLPPYYLR